MILPFLLSFCNKVVLPLVNKLGIKPVFKYYLSRPITCFPLMWKLLLGVIADQIYGELDQQKFLPEEQKGCRKRSRGTNDLLYIQREN